MTIVRLVFMILSVLTLIVALATWDQNHDEAFFLMSEALVLAVLSAASRKDRK